MIHHGDCIEVLRTLDENSVDAVVTDPPYGLSFMGKKWDYDVPSVEVWREVFRVLKPGGHLLSFGGTRTYHRMVVNVEDAGFEIRDQVQWIYGSGFPKSLDVSKAIDKAAGVEREVIGKRTDGATLVKGSKDTFNSSRGPRDPGTKVMDVTAPATDDAKQWQGWGTALKPSHEIIVCARKPLTGADLLANLALECQSKLFAEIVSRYLLPNLSEKTQQSIAQWLAGKCTLTPDVLSEVMDMLQSKSADNSYLSTELSWLNTLGGIWTHANMCTTEMESSLTTDLKILKSLLLSNTQESTLDLARPIEPLSASLAANLLSALELKLNFIHTPFAQELATSPDALSNLRPNSEPIALARKPLEKGLTVAANVLKWGCGAINVDGSRIATDDKISGSGNIKRETKNSLSGGGMLRKETGVLTGAELGLGRFPANVLFDESAAQVLDAQTKDLHGAGTKRSGGQAKQAQDGGLFGIGQHDGNGMRFGDSGGASRFFYVAKASKRERGEGNIHPTVKPIKLMEYLIKLITPPGGVVLDPFMGSGSTGVAAKKLGFEFVGIEMNADYVEIARRRIG